MNKNTALIIIDVQEAFEDKKWGVRNNPQAEENIRRILSVWREKGWKVIHVQHTSDNPDSLFYPGNKGFAIKESVQPENGEKVITKKVNSSFIGTDLEETLKRNDISTVIITGLTTPHCVSTTTRMSGNLGFDTYLVSDATAAFGLTDQNNVYYDAETIYNVSLATLHNEFATVLSTAQLLDKIK
ncbi:cysteine hydrolase family protein [Virgibacillus senegalensis]|uniref:cysteine hydrolase family protein n=1 Tax=Virgibacillus senegalensis TaxID=1499679 RepID=UPI00069ECE6F|nr:cysteine hydrolase family protein [Virgibacillus senegalensis]